MIRKTERMSTLSSLLQTNNTMREITFRSKVLDRVNLQKVLDDIADDDDAPIAVTISRSSFRRAKSRMIVDLVANPSCRQLTILSCRDLRYLFDAVGDYRKVIHLDKLTIVNPSQDGVASLCSELIRGSIIVETLSLSTSLSAYAPVCLHRALRHATISHLELADCFWDASAVSVMADAFSKDLKSLNLSGGHLEGAHLAQIVTALQGHPSLEELDISCNTCLQDGSEAIGKVLRTTPKLRRLEMNGAYRGKR